MRDNKHYEVRRCVAEDSPIVCFSVDRARPDSYMDLLELELQGSHFRGDVVLDLFATNGNNHRRFMRLWFDGMKLHWLQAKIAKRGALSLAVLKFCDDFYLSHPEIVEKSVLSHEAQLNFLGEHAYI